MVVVHVPVALDVVVPQDRLIYLEDLHHGVVKKLYYAARDVKLFLNSLLGSLLVYKPIYSQSSRGLHCTTLSELLELLFHVPKVGVVRQHLSTTCNPIYSLIDNLFSRFRVVNQDGTLHDNPTFGLSFCKGCRDDTSGVDLYLYLIICLYSCISKGIVGV